MGFLLLEELNRRRVFRALVAYGIAAFAILQIIEPVMHGLHWPDAVLSYTVVALAIGFPLVIALAWAFDVRAGRIERTPPSAGALRGPLLAALIVGLGVVAATPGVLYYFVVRRAPAPPPTAAAPSIAVLPFVNMSAEKDNEYFSAGITEELINALANVEGLRVVSRTAVFALKGKDLDVPQIGAQLKASTLLEGSVRRHGDELRITAQLINVGDGYHLWSQTYDRELKNIFAVEDDWFWIGSGCAVPAPAQTLRASSRAAVTQALARAGDDVAAALLRPLVTELERERPGEAVHDVLHVDGRAFVGTQVFQAEIRAMLARAWRSR